MKRLFIFMTAGLTAFSMLCREPQRGYRGFVDLEMDAGKIWHSDDAAGKDIYGGLGLFGLSTTHGYQINNHIFTGLGFLAAASPATGMLPIFADFRYDNKWGKFTPFGDIRIGYDLANGSLYLSPTIGYRFNWGRKVNLNLGAGMTIKGYKRSEFNTATMSIVSIKSYNPMFTLRFGIDF